MLLKGTKKRTFKKILTTVGAAICTCFTSLTANAATPVVGDVDHDGAITAVDASYVLTYYADTAVGKEAFIDETLADVDADGSISAVDASHILSYYAANSVGENIAWPPQQQSESEVTSTTTNSEGTSTITTTAPAIDYQGFNLGDMVEFTGLSWNVRSSTSFSNNVSAYLESTERFEIVDVLSDNWYIISNERIDCQFVRINSSEIQYFRLISTSAETTTTTTTATTATTTTTTTTSTTTTTTATNGNCCCTCSTTATTTTPVSVGDMFAFTGNYWRLYDEEGATNSVALLEHNQGIDIWEIGTQSNWYKVQVNNKSVYWIYLTPENLEKYFPDFWEYWESQP